ncbi:MAG: RNA 3'-terminal phosphate cyclase, partial [Candidatus Omnitrophica bacterium]|nr:RNA 3'-terminal phosphate cyclase [Candidatus Omnitrophota bacterium]
MPQIKSLLEIPGDYLEGGGQILRTALALSVIAQRPVRIFNIRLKRENPGLRQQHFNTLWALKEISDARVEGFYLGSREIKFYPLRIKSCELDIDIKTAGSIGLTLQPLIPVGCFSSLGLTLNIKGGTSGRGAIPIEYYWGVIIPILKRIGIEVKLDLIKRGYYPKGGGEVKVRIEPKINFTPLNLTEQGGLIKIEGISHANGNLKKQRVAERQKDKAEE